MRVLLVEDEDYIRDLFKRQLDLAGFQTDAFATGQEGLTATTQNGYDLVLLDIMLPDINGLQILQKLRLDPKTKNIAIVLLTNLGQDAVIKQGFELGADGYLVKAAYTPDQIVQEVRNILQKKMSTPQPAIPPVDTTNTPTSTAPSQTPQIPIQPDVDPTTAPTTPPAEPSTLINQPTSDPTQNNS